METRRIILHYGAKTLHNFIPRGIAEAGNLLTLRHPEPLRTVPEAGKALRTALEKPVGLSPPFSALVRAGTRRPGITIVIDDQARSNTHTRLLLPPLLHLLHAEYDMPRGRINLLVATGTHRGPTEKELRHITGLTANQRPPVFSHDCDEGNEVVGCSGSLPIGVNQRILETGILILLSDIEYHYFSGVAGGPKMLCPGLCDRRTIEQDHLAMFGPHGFAPGVGPGMLDGNPVYEQKKRIAGRVLDTLDRNGTAVFCLTAIIDPGGRLVYLNGGETFTVHRVAASFLPRVWTVRLERPADLVVAGAGHLGFSFYQAGKALNAAMRAVKPGGRLLLAAPCHDGIGNTAFETLLEKATSFLLRKGKDDIVLDGALTAVMESIRAEFHIGAQKMVDLLEILRHVGRGHLHGITDGLSGREKGLLPVMFEGNEREPPEMRIREWIKRYGKGKTVAVINAPGQVIVCSM